MASVPRFFQRGCAGVCLRAGADMIVTSTCKNTLSAVLLGVFSAIIHTRVERDPSTSRTGCTG